MLDEARQKIGNDPKYRLIVGDIFTRDFAQHGGEIDLAQLGALAGHAKGHSPTQRCGIAARSTSRSLRYVAAAGVVVIAGSCLPFVGQVIADTMGRKLRVRLTGPQPDQGVNESPNTRPKKSKHFLLSH